MSKTLIPIPEVKQSEIVHKGFFSIRIDTLELPHGVRKPYTVLETGRHAAAVLALTPDQKYVVLKEYRHPTGKWLYGCPGGRIDAGESPMEAAQRELLEETGYEAEEFTTLGSAYPFASVCEQKIHFVLAKGAKCKQRPTLEPFELITTSLLTDKELKTAIASGDPIDGVLLTALYFHSLTNHS